MKNKTINDLTYLVFVIMIPDPMQNSFRGSNPQSLTTRERGRERYIRVVWEFKGKMFYFTQRSGGKRESISGVESGHLQ